jgi:hypothetical protein
MRRSATFGAGKAVFLPVKAVPAVRSVCLVGKAAFLSVQEFSGGKAFCRTEKTLARSESIFADARACLPAGKSVYR